MCAGDAQELIVDASFSACFCRMSLHFKRNAGRGRNSIGITVKGPADNGGHVFGGCVGGGLLTQPPRFRPPSAMAKPWPTHIQRSIHFPFQPSSIPMFLEPNDALARFGCFVRTIVSNLHLFLCGGAKIGFLWNVSTKIDPLLATTVEITLI